ncbi:MAG: hypothetical protein R3D84_01325 [Paracoccaceae bacterium]
MMIHDAFLSTASARLCGHQTVAILHDRHSGPLDRLGPMPREALKALQAYGMDDDDIGRYYGVSAASVRRLKRVLTAG